MGNHRTRAGAGTGERKGVCITARLTVSTDLDVPAEVAFARICAAETWPVWFSIVKRASLCDPRSPLGPDNELTVQSELSSGEDEIYELDGYMAPFFVSLVGAYSCRRRIEFKVERKNDHARLHVHIEYPTYGGFFKAIVDRFTFQRRLRRALHHSLANFKGLVEHDETDLRERAEHALATELENALQPVVAAGPPERKPVYAGFAPTRRNGRRAS